MRARWISGCFTRNLERSDLCSRPFVCAPPHIGHAADRASCIDVLQRRELIASALYVHKLFSGRYCGFLWGNSALTCRIWPMSHLRPWQWKLWRWSSLIDRLVRGQKKTLEVTRSSCSST